MILALGFLLAVYLVAAMPSTSVLPSASYEDGLLKGIGRPAITGDELQAHVLSLVRIGNDASQTSAFLGRCAVVMLVLFAVLCILNLVWLAKLKNLKDETPVG